MLAAVPAEFELSAALDFFDFLLVFWSVALASAVVVDESAAFAFFDFFAFVVLVSSVLELPEAL